MISKDSALPICPACSKPVPLETAKTDDHGRAIHEKCYVLNLLFERTAEHQTEEKTSYNS